MATKLGFKRILATILAAAVAIPATAGDWMPLLPDQDFYDFQLFAPPHLQEYSVRQSPRDGVFLSYDRLYWGITPPPVQAVGNRDFFVTEVLSPDVIARLNNQQPTGLIPPFIIYGTPEARFDLNTSWMMTEMTWGNRFDVGWIYDDYGAFVRYFSLQPQSQEFTTINEFAVNSPTQTLTTTVVPPGLLAPGFVTVTLLNQSGPPDHLISQRFIQQQTTELQSVSVGALARRTMMQSRPVTVSLAGRFVQLADRYSIDYISDQRPFAPQVGGTPPSLTYDGPLQQGEYDVRTFNNMAGPEFGLNFENTVGRWTFGLDLRFTPAMNWQNNLYDGSNFPVWMSADYVRATIDSEQVIVVPGQGGTVSTTNNNPLIYQTYQTRQDKATNSAEHNFVFSPIGEWTLETRFRVSQSVLLRLGYTGTWMAGIARASTNTAYVSKTEQVRVLELNEPNRPPQPNIDQPNYNPWVARDIPIDYTTARPAQGNDQTYVFMNGVNFGIEMTY